MTPAEALSRALTDALDRRLIVPCVIGGADRWTSDDPQTLEAAAQECHGCPITPECAAASEGEKWGAWAGRVVVPSWQGGRRKEKSA